MHTNRPLKLEKSTYFVLCKPLQSNLFKTDATVGPLRSHNVGRQMDTEEDSLWANTQLSTNLYTPNMATEANWCQKTGPARDLTCKALAEHSLSSSPSPH